MEQPLTKILNVGFYFDLSPICISTNHRLDGPSLFTFGAEDITRLQPVTLSHVPGATAAVSSYNNLSISH